MGDGQDNINVLHTEKGPEGMNGIKLAKDLVNIANRMKLRVQ
jgi:hypothetical protein